MLLLAVALRTSNTAQDSRRVREAARAINVFFGAARNHAMERGRPVGVILQRMPGLPAACMTLHEAEMPPPYAGDTVSARANVVYTTDASNRVVGISARIPTSTLTGAQSFADEWNQSLMRLNGQDPAYTIAGTSVSGSYTVFNLVLDSSSSSDPMLTLRGYTYPTNTTYTAHDSMPFEILRPPVPAVGVVRRSAGASMSLPTGAVIDLQFSGTESLRFHSSDTNPIVIMFAPNGSAEWIYCRWTSGSYGRYPMTSGQLYLLVGQRERIGSTRDMYNWQELSNLWVTLSPQSGLVVAKENTSGSSYTEARTYAKTTQGVGGR